MDRRTFLSIVAGSPFVFGLRELLAQEASPDFVDAALKRMKATKRFGVFLVIPTDLENRKRLGQALLDRLAVGSKADRDGFDLFCAHVFVCLSEQQAAKAGLEVKVEGEGLLRLLLNPEGKRIEADRVKPEVIQNPGKFAESFSAFIHGEGGARLREHVKTIEKDFTPEIKKATEQVNTDQTGESYRKLMEEADSIAPWLVQKKIDAPESKFSLILWDFQLRQSGQDHEVILPFGIRVEKVRAEDPCPPCGMAAYRRATYRFVSFYAK